MDYRATIRYARISPTKVRHLADLVRGRSARDGLETLRYLPHRGARMLEKALRSAIANAEESGVRNADALVVRTAGVDTGPTLKRIQPHARGMGFMIKKRMSHITVSVSVPDKK
jgi:large subunit ribosomal protein L22